VIVNNYKNCRFCIKVDDNVQPGSIQVTVGAWSLSGTPRRNQRTLGVERFITHPGYLAKDRNAHNDITLIKLKSSIKFGVGVAAIAFAPAGYGSSGSGKISGWGRTGSGNAPYPDILPEANVNLLSNADCV